MKKKYQILKKIAKLKALTIKQWGWLFIAIYKLLYVSVKIRLYGFKWIKRIIMEDVSSINNQHNNESKTDDLRIAQQLHESIRLAARCLPFKLECLPKAMVLAKMLQARHIRAVVKLGVNNDEQQLKGHAWVSILGNAIVESEGMNNKFIELKF